jgi:RNA polymerase sigma-70 factor (ECF subfamily)
MLLHDSRREARLTPTGELILLEEQDRTLWDSSKIQEGTAILDHAMTLRDPGPYQVQAAISALHAEAQTYEATDWTQISMLYDTLAKMTPSVVIEVNRAVAVSKAKDAQAGLQILLSLENEADNFYPYHAARADLLRRMNQHEAAADAYQRALALCGNGIERAYLQRRLDEILNFLA